MNDKQEAERYCTQVSILTPTGRDAELVAGLLRREKINTVVCETFDDLLKNIRAGRGPFVLSEEAVSGKNMDRLLQTLDEQPEWSDLPSILLTRRFPGWQPFDRLAASRSMNVIRRPVRKKVLVSMVKAALEVRRRQYQIRDLLEDLKRTNEKLGKRTILLQQLALEMTRSEERERRRIAKILHDDLQQILVSAKMQTEMLEESLSEPKARIARRLYKTLSTAMDSSRSLSHELDPSFLYGRDPDEILRKIGSKMAANFGFQIDTEIDLHGNRVDEGIKIFACRTVQELLFNCVKHARADRVGLEATCDDTVLTIAVTDDGDGFDPEKLKIRGGKEGGFGLFSIHERAEALGGGFQVESSPGNGSRFVLSIPSVMKDSAEDEKNSASEFLRKADDDNDPEKKVPENDRIGVLIADDHAVLRQGLASLLRNQPGIRVLAEAGDGEQAVELALKLRPDVVLMDITMPVMNGVEATRRIKRNAPEISIIGLSMHASEEMRESIMEAGAEGYLIKDRPATELIASIKKVIE